ncbi:MAG: hypothetical protein KC422_25865, partial [Trueperaceae bacterium]|nr:hypothetical protein [Trueperaceae bacterium]
MGIGSAVEVLGTASNPFLATIGLRIEPAASNSGITFCLDVDIKSVPMFIFNAVENFYSLLETTIQETLKQGIYGWQVTDCKITLTHSGYISPSSTSADFRKLLPLVLMTALKEAGTEVCEPLQQFYLEIPVDTVGAILAILAKLDAVLQAQDVQGETCVLEGEIPVARVHEFQLWLPSLTRGEGVLETSFSRYEVVRGSFPTRRRSDTSPLNRKAYLMHVLGWSSAKS